MKLPDLSTSRRAKGGVDSSIDSHCARLNMNHFCRECSVSSALLGG